MKLVFKIFFILFALNAFAQEKTVVYTIAENSAEFPGGVTEMMKFITQTINYPPNCKENNIGGKVFLKFIVSDLGEINTVEVLKSSGNVELDYEALRVLKLMPKWKPGSMSGEAVNVYFNLPISFNISANPFFIFNTFNKDKNYISAIALINNNELDKAKEILNENDPESLYLLAVIDYVQKNKKSARKKFKKYIETNKDDSNQKYKIAKAYLEN